MRAVAAHLEMPAVLRGFTFQDAAIAEAQAENVAFPSIGYGIELHHAHRAARRHLESVSHAAEIPLTTKKTSDPRYRLALRHVPAPGGGSMQTPSLCSKQYGIVTACEN